MRYKLGCRLSYEVSAPSVFVFNVEAMRRGRQRVVEEDLRISQDVKIDRCEMPESGNRYLRVHAEPGELKLGYDALVETDPLVRDQGEVGRTSVGELPLATLPHLNPSRYCESDRLAAAANADFGHLPPGHAQVTAICNWIHEHTAYRRGASDTHTSALVTLVDRMGVCRDFAHLGVALCRALGIPARFVSAYAYRLQPPDFHAVFEAYLDGRWWLFDATRQAPVDGLVRIGCGRDAGEVSFSTIFGAVQPGIPEIFIDVDGPSPADLRTTDAVSLSED